MWMLLLTFPLISKKSHKKTKSTIFAMDELQDEDQAFTFSLPNHPPSVISLTPFQNTASRRLSSCFSPSNHCPVPAAARKNTVAWVNLEGRLVGAEEATSVRSIGGDLGNDEALGWEMFSPIHRVLIVAVVAVAVAESKKNREIWNLRKSVEVRDQVLSNMQQKLDSLCEQVNCVKDQHSNISFAKSIEVDECGCWHCDRHRDLSKGDTGNTDDKPLKVDESLPYKLPLGCEAEPEERRMSELSDWASSIASCAEIQMNTLAIEQDMYNLKRRDSDGKDSITKEPSMYLHSDNVIGSRRIAELESVIRRKNTIITKLKKDLIVLETKVQHYTRLKRKSFSPTTSSSDTKQRPLMTDNLLYDMDNTTSPSSSDSDCSTKTRTPAAAPAKVQPLPTPNSEPVLKSIPRVELIRHRSSSGNAIRSSGPLTEKSMNQRRDSVPATRTKHLSVNVDHQKNKRHIQTRSKDTTLLKRWA